MSVNSHKCSDRQKELVEKLYSVHENLRRKHRLTSRITRETNTDGVQEEEWNDTWQSHTKNSQELQEYSVAMYELATQVWDPRNAKLDQDASDTKTPSELKCRIEWVVKKCSEQFLELAMQRKLRLLDVGSCYNPFLKYEHLFDITAIDLYPAPSFEESVYQCDFLQISVCSALKPDVIVTPQFNKLVSLPRDYFDIVVFSFFLEYLPDQKQRLNSCIKAAEVLLPGGVLFVLRPDSKSMTEANVRLIKQLKVGLSLIGFKRIHYEKLQHVWCTGYIKLNNKENEEFKTSKTFQKDLAKFKFKFEHELFAIPQDFKTIKDEIVDVDIECEPRNASCEHDWKWDDIPFPFMDV